MDCLTERAICKAVTIWYKKKLPRKREVKLFPGEKATRFPVFRKCMQLQCSQRSVKKISSGERERFMKICNVQVT